MSKEGLATGSPFTPLAPLRYLPEGGSGAVAVLPLGGSLGLGDAPLLPEGGKEHTRRHGCPLPPKGLFLCTKKVPATNAKPTGRPPAFGKTPVGLKRQKGEER